MPMVSFPDRGAVYDYFQVHLVAPNRVDRYMLPAFTSLQVTGGKHGGGDGTLAFYARRHPITSELIEAEGFGYSVDVYLNDMDTPLFSGTVRSVDAVTSEPGWATSVSLQLEAIDQHLLRRRLNLTTNGALSSKLNYPADNAVLWVAGNAVGGVVPAGYPISRTDFGPAGWALNVAALHVPGSVNMVNFEEESGSNCADTIYKITEGNDLGLSIVEQSPRTWLLDVREPYTLTDHSGGWRLSDADGSLKSVRRSVDYGALSTVFLARGNGKTSAQAAQWRHDAAACALYGGFEDGATLGASTTGNALKDAADWELRRSATPIITWEIGVRDRFGAAVAFNAPNGYRMCDRIQFETYRLASPWSHPDGLIDPSTPPLTPPPTPLVVTADIVGYTLSAAGYTEPKIALVLGQPRRNLLWEIMSRNGARGGRLSGNAYSIKGGG